MKKGLLGFIFGVGLTLLGTNVYSQVKQDSIPEAVRKKVNEFLGGVPYCKNVTIKLVGEKTEDRNGDGIKDKVTLYNVEGCEVVPNYFIFTQEGLKEGGFSKNYRSEAIDRRDMGGKTVPLKEW